MNIKGIDISEYDYDLPEERIAQFPEKKRDESKLLLYNKGIVMTTQFKNISEYLSPSSLIVFNNTRVIRARMLFKKESGANIEIFCLEPYSPSNYDQSLSTKSTCIWKCIIGNLKKWKSGSLEMQIPNDNKELTLFAEKIKQEGESWLIRFSWTDENITYGELLEMVGHIPLPPYIKRKDTSEDENRYQTVYSAIDGSVAAPTAGLHFTPEVLAKINKKDIATANITLHVGAGTFKPIKGTDLSNHEMHTEHYFVSEETIKQLIAKSGSIISVGTTSVRTLESLYWLGCNILQHKDIIDDQLFTGQWEPYNNDTDIPSSESLKALLDYLKTTHRSFIEASTQIMIVPGYKFRIINGLITNFHQPKSTLLLLLAAWVGEDWKRIYNYALQNGYRFLSYGDSSFLIS